MPGTDRAAKAGKVIEGLSGYGHAGFMADVADSATLLALRTSIEQRYRQLDILINAAPNFPMIDDLCVFRQNPYSGNCLSFGGDHA